MNPINIEQLKTLCTKTGIQKYNMTAAEDALLLHWWLSLHESEDIDKLFAPNDQALGNFMSIFRGPGKMLLYSGSDSDMHFAAWYEEVFSGHTAFASIWTSPVKRGTRFQYDCALAAYSTAFAIWPSLIGITKQPDLLAEHEKFGYSVVGTLPGLFDGVSETYIVYLTQSAFENSQFINVGKGD